MKTVIQNKGEIIYVDTDSIMFKYKEEYGDPLKDCLGDTLGTLTDEYPNHSIDEFICSGNKYYALKLFNNKTQTHEFTMKSKGLTLDSSTCKRLNYTKFRSMVLDYLDNKDEQRLKLQFNKIRPQKEGDVCTVQTKRVFRPLITKGHPLRDGSVKPFGFFKHSLATSIQSYIKFIDANPDYKQQSNEPDMDHLVHLFKLKFDPDYKKRWEENRNRQEEQERERAEMYSRFEIREARRIELDNIMYDNMIQQHFSEELRRAYVFK